MGAEDRYTPTGVQRSYFVPQGTIVDRTAPSVTELGSAIEIGHSMPNALAVPRSANAVDVSDPSSKQDKQHAGTRGGEQWSFPVYQELDTGDPAAYENLTEDVKGDIVIFRQGHSDPIAAGDVCTVVPFVVGSVADVDSGRNEADRAQVNLFITEEIARDAVVAA